MQVKTGMPAESVDVVTRQLEVLLANNHVLYLKSRNYHWNLEDPRFISLHALFEEQYTLLADHGDLIAERIRQLGKRSPGSLQEFSQLATMAEAKELTSGDAMIDDLAASHEACAMQLRTVIAESEELGDPTTADILIELCRAHEKSAWILRSHLG